MDFCAEQGTRGSSQPSKDPGLIAIEQNAVLDVPADRSGKNHFLEVTAFADKVFHRIAMRHADDVLFDDGAVVQNFGYVVAGSADQFHAPFEGLVVRAGADESG